MINHATTEVFFEGAEIPVENLIGEEGKGFKYVLGGDECRANSHCI